MEANEMNNFTAQQLKDSMVELYSMNDDLSCEAYRIAFDQLEAKIGEEKLYQFLDSYGM